MHRKAGFTLVELIIVMSILGILSAILIPVLSSIIFKANEAVDLANARMIYSSAAVSTTENDAWTAGIYEAEADGSSPDLLDEYIGVTWPFPRQSGALAFRVVIETAENKMPDIKIYRISTNKTQLYNHFTNSFD